MGTRRLAAVVILALVFLGAADSAASPPPQNQPGNPLATQDHLRLSLLLGEWEEEIGYADASSAEDKNTGRWTARTALGLYLRIQYTDTSPGARYRAFGVIAYDSEESIYRMWWYDNQGGIGEYRGQFVDDNTLVLEHSERMAGRAFRERIRYTRVSPNELRTTIEQAWGTGDFKPYLEAVARRTNEGSPRR